MYTNIALVSSAMLTIERPPQPLAMLAGICEKNNIHYSVFDYNIFLLKHLGVAEWERIGNLFADQFEIIHEDSVMIDILDRITDAAANEILSSKPDLIALTSFSVMQISWTKKLLEKIREKSAVTIIAGCPGIIYEQQHETSAGKILANQGLVDYYVLGEGDIVFDEFLNGTVSLGVNHKTDKFESWVPQINDLDALIVPSYKKIKSKRLPLIFGWASDGGRLIWQSWLCKTMYIL